MFHCLFFKVKNGFSFIYPLYSKCRYFRMGYSVHYDITGYNPHPTLLGFEDPNYYSRVAFAERWSLSLFNFIPFNKWMKSKNKNLETFSGNSFFESNLFPMYLESDKRNRQKEIIKGEQPQPLFIFIFWLMNIIGHFLLLLVMCVSWWLS